MNISGNYNTENREIEIVKRIFDKHSIPYLRIEKYENADDGDILVQLSEQKQLLIEVKEESSERFEKYGDLGIDFISAFQFKTKEYEEKWKTGPKSPRLLPTFWADVDTDTHFKLGKLSYSKSDLWLFFISDGKRFRYRFFDGKKIVCESFRNYLKKHCLFAVNNKPSSQESHSDKHHSAVFFIHHTDAELQKARVDLEKYVKDL